MFIRTAHGLQNQCKFFGVDRIIYVEGSESLTYEQIVSGSYSDESDDILFWQNVISVIRPELKVKYKSIGSKSNLVKLNMHFSSNGITNLLVAMDRDYDGIKCSLLSRSNCLNTFGYSWENDIWDKDIIKEVFYSVSRTCRTSVNVDGEITAMLDLFNKKIKWSVYADLLLTYYGSSLFDREKPAKYIQTRTHLPVIDNTRLIKDYKQKYVSSNANASVLTHFNTKQIIPQIDCFGKMYSTYIYQCIIGLLNKYCDKPPKISKISLYVLAISEFCNKRINNTTSSYYTYYQALLAAI